MYQSFALRVRLCGKVSPQDMERRAYLISALVSRIVPGILSKLYSNFVIHDLRRFFCSKSALLVVGRSVPARYENILSWISRAEANLSMLLP